MRALTWHGKRDVRVDTVPDPAVRAVPTSPSTDTPTWAPSTG
ncbi:hypothetical protein [Streptomyces lavendulae]|nr:hypothetical protein [Streptomyces lavendulae]